MSAVKTKRRRRGEWRRQSRSLVALTHLPAPLDSSGAAAEATASASSILETSFDSALLAPRDGPATSEHSGVEFYAELEALAGVEVDAPFVHPSLYVEKLVEAGCFSLVAARVPVALSPHFLGGTEHSHRAVCIQLRSKLFRFHHSLGGMPLSHGAYTVAGPRPLHVPVHPELKGVLSLSVDTQFCVLAPPPGASVYVSITSLDRKRATGRCVATVLFLCEGWWRVCVCDALMASFHTCSLSLSPSPL